MRKSYLVTLGTILVAILFVAATLRSGNPPTGWTGAGTESTCNLCHSGASPNSGLGVLTFSMDGGTANYTPGNTHTVNVSLTDPTQTRFGFSLTVLDSNDNAVGTLIRTDMTNTSLASSNGRQYMGHRNAGSFNTWQFDWQAPATDVGPVHFYVSSNAADFNFGTSGDTIYNGIYTFTTPVASEPCSRDIFEPNDTIAEAAALPIIGIFESAGICDDGDIDWYTFNVASAQNNILLRLVAPDIDLSAEVYSPQNMLIQSQTAVANGEAILDMNNLATGTHYIKIYNSSDASSSENYKLFIQRRNTPFIRSATSIKDLTSETSFTVYSPSSDQLRIKWNAQEASSYTLSLIDVKGQTVLTQHLREGKGSIEKQLFTGQLKAGVYWIQLESIFGRNVKKIAVF